MVNNLVYEFAGYASDIHCGLPLRCHGGGSVKHAYYKDVAKKRQLPCPAGGFLQVRVDDVRLQFGEMLEGFRLPGHWREEVRRKMLESMAKAGLDMQGIEREKERLKLKRTRILKQHRDGYIDDVELQSEMASVELALRGLEVPEMDGLRLDDIVAAGERLPGIAALWEVATSEERRDMVLLMLEPGGLYYDLELKTIAAVRPRPAFLPVMRLIEGFIEYKEATGALVTSQWRRRNRRATGPLSPTLVLFLEPHGKLYLKLQQVLTQLQLDVTAPLSLATRKRPEPAQPKHGIPQTEWADVVQRVAQNQEPLHTVAKDYDVSYEN